MKNQLRVVASVVISIAFLILAGGSTETTAEKLAQKYDISAEEVAQCQSLFDDNAEKAMAYLKDNPGGLFGKITFFGLFKDTCSDLAKRQDAFGGPDNMFVALKFNWEPGSDELEAYIKRREKQKQAEAEAKREAEIARQNSCLKKWENCANNADLINNFEGMTEVKTACQYAIEDQASYGDPDWGGWLTIPFSKFYKGRDYIEEGIVRVVDDEVKLQNGFGAMVNTTVYCHYDLREEEVVRAYSK